MQYDKELLQMLTRIAGGSLSPEEAAQKLRYGPFAQTIEGVTPDFHRKLRTGFGETVFAQNKDDKTLIAAISRLSCNNTNPVLATRVSPEQGALLCTTFPTGHYYPHAAIFCLHKQLQLEEPFSHTGDALVVSAGSADKNVALEAYATLLFHGFSTAFAQDIGICGLHRVKPWLEVFDTAKIIIVVAGMEGALPSLIAGLTSTPIVAVPTSVGYGANLGGITTLLSMLTSCAPGISVVNIDNGYGAAMFAAKFLTKLTST